MYKYSNKGVFMKKVLLYFGTKLLGISTATIGVVGFCCAFTPEVAKLIISKSISAWNKIIICITSLLPTGVTLVINGVILKTI
jgi:hypothetical protein